MSARPSRAAPAGGNNVLQPGDTVDRYEVVRVLGQGGMAAVLEVRHRDLGTHHALKVLQVQVPGLDHRLIQEGRMQAALTDPHVCRVTDVVRVGGMQGLVMELVQGPALDMLLANYQPNLLQIDHLARGMIAGVRAAHAAGLVHRDLKPGNVLIDVRDGKVIPKVADFGLAKAIGDSMADRGGMRTVSGTTMGTPTFMSPEQFRDARKADQRSDIFSLGCILYEVVSGIPAFVGDDAIDVYRRTSSGDYRSLREVAPNLPDRMISTIDKALRPDPAERWQDCDTMLRAWCGDVPDEEAARSWEPSQLALLRSLAPSNHPLGSSVTVATDGGLDPVVLPSPPKHPTAVGGLPSTIANRAVLGLVSLGTVASGLLVGFVITGITVGIAIWWWSTSDGATGHLPDGAPAAEPVAVAPRTDPEPPPGLPVPETPSVEVPTPAPSPPAPAPEAAPAAPRRGVPPPAPHDPTAGRVMVEGVERAWLVRTTDGKQLKPGNVPAGRYDVLVFFVPDRPTKVMTLELAAGDVRTVRCDPELKLCR